MLKLVVEQDTDPLDPRKEYDQFTTMVCWHRRYNLGDEQPKQSPDEYWESVKDESVGRLPIYMCDHGGITISSCEFGCTWDSGQVGFIWMSKAQQKACGCPDDKIQDHLELDIMGYDMYLRGDVYRFSVEDTETGETLDACGGFYGEEYCREQGNYSLEYHEKQYAESAKSKAKEEMGLERFCEELLCL